MARLGIDYPVLIDSELRCSGRTTRTRAGPRATCSTGARGCSTTTTARAPTPKPSSRSRSCWACEREPLAPLRPEDAPGAQLAPQTADQPGAYSGPYEAGGVWAVLDGSGDARGARQRARLSAEVRVEHPGAFPLFEHERHTEGVLELDVGAGVRCHAVCFTPGVR